MDIGLKAGRRRSRRIRIVKLTDGYGADAVIITAASASSEILAEAFQACRRKARVVVVGDVGLNIDRSDIYAKELDFLISTSYGPGRYDPVYEEQGADYPLAYVRWTENRNMAEYLAPAWPRGGQPRQHAARSRSTSIGRKQAYARSAAPATGRCLYF